MNSIVFTHHIHEPHHVSRFTFQNHVSEPRFTLQNPMNNTLTTIYSLLLALFMLLMLYLYVFQWKNLPDLGRLFG